MACGRASRSRALLGYRFERRLHDLRPGPVHRAAARARAAVGAQAGERRHLPVESIAANNVVDGLVLNQKWRDAPNAVTGALQPARPTTAELASRSPRTGRAGGLDRRSERRADRRDRVPDGPRQHLAHREHAEGDRARRCAGAGARGGPHPAQRHRADASRAAAVQRQATVAGLGPATTPARTAEPMLNSWAAKLLGTRKVRCTVERSTSAGAVLETRRLRLSDLQLAPLDVVYGVPATGGRSIRRGDIERIEERIVDLARRSNGFPPGARCASSTHARPISLPGADAARRAGAGARRAALLTTARGADSEDLNPPPRGDGR